MREEREEKGGEGGITKSSKETNLPSVRASYNSIFMNNNKKNLKKDYTGIYKTIRVRMTTRSKILRLAICSKVGKRVQTAISSFLKIL